MRRKVIMDLFRKDIFEFLAPFRDHDFLSCGIVDVLCRLREAHCPQGNIVESAIGIVLDQRPVLTSGGGIVGRSDGRQVWKSRRWGRKAC
jgi:hypothetical protein